MTERDFAYWLQGYFEILEVGVTHSDVHELSHNQIVCIKNHINLVRTTQKTSVLLTSIEALLEHDVTSVRKVINAYFEHVIDPQHPNQDAANEAHSGELIPHRPPRMRC